MGNHRISLSILIGLFAVAAGGVCAATHYRMTQKRQPEWKFIPDQFDGWTGVNSSFDPLYGADPADSSMLRVYRQGDNPPVIVYVGFFADLTAILEVHTPELCYPAQGWSILSSRKSVNGTYRGKSVAAEEIVVDKAGDRRLVAWWYCTGSRPFESRIRYIYAMLALSTFTGRTDGSMVRLETPIQTSPEAAEIRIRQFRRSFLPMLSNALPQ